MISSEDVSSSSPSQTIALNAVEIAKKARAQAASACLKKSTQTDIHNLNTTAGLNYAKNSANQPGSDKIKITVESVHIKRSSKRSTAGESYGKWIKSWAKDVYLTGRHTTPVFVSIHKDATSTLSQKS